MSLIVFIVAANRHYEHFMECDGSIPDSLIEEIFGLMFEYNPHYDQGLIGFQDEPAFVKAVGISIFYFWM